MNFARKRLLSLLNTSDVVDPGKVLQQVLLKLWRQPDRQNHGGWQQAGAAAACQIFRDLMAPHYNRTQAAYNLPSSDDQGLADRIIG